MTETNKKEISREVGLEIGEICGSYFLKLDHLHYGFWEDGLKVDITNLHLAQQKYAEFVISQIPSGVKTILDVGGGTGYMAKLLIEKGYDVECVSPSAYLTSRIRQVLGNRIPIYECLYQNLQVPKKYDMVFFCESFQYIDMKLSLPQTVKYLNEGGFMMIIDFFRKDQTEKSVMGGGHRLNKFYNSIENFPFKLVSNIDITKQTAPTMDLYADIIQKVIKPVIAAGTKLVESRYATILKLIKWKFKKKLNKLNNKYFCNNISGEEFKKYKSYQLFLYQKSLS